MRSMRAHLWVRPIPAHPRLPAAEGSFMLERCTQMADAFLAHLQRWAAKKADPVRSAAAAALTRDALLSNIHYFRARDHVEQARAGRTADWVVLCAGRRVAGMRCSVRLTARRLTPHHAMPPL